MNSDKIKASRLIPTRLVLLEKHQRVFGCDMPSLKEKGDRVSGG